MSLPSSSSNSDQSAARRQEVLKIVEQFIARQTAGQNISDDDLIAAHPELQPDLAEALRLRHLIHQQRLAARRAGPVDAPLDLLSPSRLDEPLDPHVVGWQDDPAHLRIDGYKIDHEISRGGQASVFLGYQEVTGRRVAIKVMAGGPFITSLNRTRFDREVRALAMLEHPGIVRVIDKGRTADGSFFFVMDYVDGTNLDVYLHEQNPNPKIKNEKFEITPESKTQNQNAQIGITLAMPLQRRIVELFVRIADAVAEAHRHKIIHRDIKPSNILVDHRGEPHLLDFGLASLTDPAQGNDRRVTATGHVIGSLPWASPEQVAGQIGKIGSHTDVYSLGVILYESLTGRPTYANVGSIPEMSHVICNSIPPSPASIPDPPFGAVDLQLSQIILKAIAKSPSDRYSDAGEFAAELRRYLAGQPTYAARAVHPKRNWIYAALLVLAIAVGIALAAIFRSGPPTVQQTGNFTNSVGMQFTRIPAGRYIMGSPWSEKGRSDNEKQYLFTFAHPFFLARTETTQAQYLRVMDSLPQGNVAGEINLPVDHVTFAQALEFCRRLSKIDGRQYRLPTEAEWEYACRANMPGPFNGERNPTRIAWFAGNSAGHLHVVRHLAANMWGLFDMHGNVAEWCTQHLGSTTQPATSSAQLISSRAFEVVRGGSYASPAENCRAASRQLLPPDTAAPGIGFRVLIPPK